jgi:hypothetical protein
LNYDFHALDANAQSSQKVVDSSQKLFGAIGHVSIERLKAAVAHSSKFLSRYSKTFL